MPRPRSPCTEKQRRLPNYIAAQRQVPKGSTETLARFRYELSDNGAPCRIVGSDHVGRTQCWAPKEHSRRRRNCTFLANPSEVTPNFKPGLYVFGSERFKEAAGESGPKFQCKGFDITETFTQKTWSTSDASTTPDDFSVLVLGPYVDIDTSLLAVRCIQLENFHSSMENSVANFGKAFLSLNDNGNPEALTPVPTPEMIAECIIELHNMNIHSEKETTVLKVLENIHSLLALTSRRLKRISEKANEDATFQKNVRKLMKLLFELALYSRRWAGPNRPFASGLHSWSDEDHPGRNLKIPPPVNTPSNPLSPKLEPLHDGSPRYVSPQVGSVRISNTGNLRTDDTDELGMLVNMQIATAQSLRMLIDSMPTSDVRILRSVCRPGHPYYMIDGSGYYLSTEDMNFTLPPQNGNGNLIPVDLFQIIFGTPTADVDDIRQFSAHSSMHGNHTYCTQIGSSVIGRCVVTILPYIYKTRPTWAAFEGGWHSIHL